MLQLVIIDHINFTVVGADGQYTKPHTEIYMQVSTGQRFDVIFQAKTTAELAGKTDYLIQFETKDRPSVYYGYGVLRYLNSTATITTGPTMPPITLSNATYSWLEYALEPLEPSNFPTADEVTRRITIYDRQIFTRTDIWRLNGPQWNVTTPPYPGDRQYLVDIYEYGQSAMPDFQAALNNSGWDPYTCTWPAKLGGVLEII